jgi:hypothetical protein
MYHRSRRINKRFIAERMEPNARDASSGRLATNSDEILSQFAHFKHICVGFFFALLSGAILEYLPLCPTS